MVGQFFNMASAKKNETSGDDGQGGDSEGLPDGGWISIFRFETISLFIQMVYAVITFVSLMLSFVFILFSLYLGPGEELRTHDFGPDWLVRNGAM